MNFEPNWTSPPGATIARLMAVREISFDELADGLGLESNQLHALIDGESRITEGIAAALADHLGSSSRFWIARDKTYVKELARLNAAPNLDSASWSRAMPVRSMKQFGWITKVARGNELIDELLDFFGCGSLLEWQENYSRGVGAVAFRTSFAFEADDLATLVWLRAGERRAASLPLGHFDPLAFESLLPNLKKLSAFKHPASFLPRLQAACQRAGVAVTTARAPEGCRASGASWISGAGNPIIHLSFRHRSEDHFWFTFFHEAAHVVLHGGEHIDVEGSDPAPFGGGNKEEEANAFAERILLPANVREELLAIAPTTSNVISAARAARVTAGIVVGQLEKAGAIKHGKLSFLKHRYRWMEDPYVPVLS